MNGKRVALRMAVVTTVAIGTAVLTAQTRASNASPGPVAAPTFARDVAPILYEKCVRCHRPEGIAPMALLDYKDVRPWAKSISTKVAARVMPPWFADPRYGKFSNDHSMSQEQVATLVAWVSGGARQGDLADLPPAPDLPAGGWTIGTPDLVLELQKDFEIPASGTIEYQYFEVPTNLTEDKWIQAVEVMPTDPRHVHHSVVSVSEPGGNDRPVAMTARAIVTDEERNAPPVKANRPKRGAGEGEMRNVLVNYAVGEDAPIYPRDYAKRLKAGSTLVFSNHYTTDGTPGRDRTRIGLIFAKKPPIHEVRTGNASHPLLLIPPFADNYKAEVEVTFTSDVRLMSLHPHMHLRGKDMEYRLDTPDGNSRIVLSVPKFDFAWQLDYWLAEPITAPKGSKLHVTAHYDNSRGNKGNPDPSVAVRWGDQTWEEMLVAWFTYVVDDRRNVTAMR